jgi:hypothetical protein
MAEDEPMENWKQFQGTELGSLLGSIYGSKSAIKINYPKVKANSSSNLEKKDFIPGGAKLDASDPRKITRKSVNLKVPKPVGRNNSGVNLDGSDENGYKLIDIIPKRRSADVIKNEIEDIRMRQEKYRPAHVQAYSSDREKDRLNQIFTFKGGKGLPEELTHPVGEAPFETQQRQKEKERLDSIRMKRGLMVVNQPSEPRLSVNEQMAQHISREIEERTQHYEEMKKIGGISAEQDRRMRQEIAIKVDELKRINLDV